MDKGELVEWLLTSAAGIAVAAMLVCWLSAFIGSANRPSGIRRRQAVAGGTAYGFVATLVAIQLLPLDSPRWGCSAYLVGAGLACLVASYLSKPEQQQPGTNSSQLLLVRRIPPPSAD